MYSIIYSRPLKAYSYVLSAKLKSATVSQISGLAMKLKY